MTSHRLASKGGWREANNEHFGCFDPSSALRNPNYRGATAWNSLPVEMRLIKTYNHFKSMQKKLMQNLL